MSDECLNCFKCHKQNIETATDYLFTCDKCGKGLCESCGKAVRTEVNTIFDNTHCNFCTTDMTEFCQDCYSHMDEVIERHKELKQKKPELFIPGQPGIYEKIIPAGEINRDWIQAVLGFWDECRCDKRCNCYLDVLTHVKKKHDVNNFYLQEIYDPDIDYMISVCYECLDKMGNKDKQYEGFAFHGQKRESPMF